MGKLEHVAQKMGRKVWQYKHLIYFIVKNIVTIFSQSPTQRMHIRLQHATVKYEIPALKVSSLIFV